MHISLLILMDLYTDTQWFLKPSFDFEMKQYQCLAIGQKVSEEIDLVKLWPWHDYLDESVRIMAAFKNHVAEQENAWKKALRHVNLSTQTLHYESEEAQNDIQEVQQIIDYAYPKLTNLQRKLSHKKSEIINNIEVDHLGLFASDIHHGFLAIEHISGLRLYDYYLSNITHRNRRLDMTYLDTVALKISTPKLINHVYQISPGPYKQFWYLTGTNELPVKESLEPLVSSYMVDVIQGKI